MEYKPLKVGNLKTKTSCKMEEIVVLLLWDFRGYNMDIEFNISLKIKSVLEYA